MKLAARIALLVAAIAPLAAQGDAAPRVTLAMPGVGNGAIERFTLRFSAAMVPLGDPRATAPAKTACAGTGRWVDQATWVYDFAAPLTGGTSCDFTLEGKLKSVAGYAVAGTQSFKVDAGGPIARSVLPERYGGEIEEDQTFLVAANMALDRASVGANAYCAIDGLGEKVPVDVLGDDVPSKLLAGLTSDRWEVRSFLENAGLPADLPATASDRQAALKSVVALKCRRPLPPGRDVALVWGAGISGGGRAAGADQRFDFTVRKPFAARFECSRVNPRAGCNPVRPAWVRFSAPIPRAQAGAIRLQLPDGKTLMPVFEDDDKTKAAISDVKFATPLPGATTAKLLLPADVKDESGRALSNAERFPLDVRFDAPPPLVKFAATFGVLEASEGGMLPVTVRNIEPALAGQMSAVAGQTLRLDASDGEIAEWLRHLSDHEESDFEDRKLPNGESQTINNTASKPLIPTGKGAPLDVALPGKGKEFEVVGIPLRQPGFYVVELASPLLGQALLGRNAPRYVTAGALVTNMSVHFKWGREGSLAWVTALDSAKPVSGADVRITDSCTGALLARGTTDAGGRLLVTKGVPEPEAYGSCEGEGNAHPLMISARKSGDFAFDLTSWSEGIRPYDFDLPYGWQAKSEVVHTILDRALARQGETVHMKHIWRQPYGAGFRMGEPVRGTLRLSHRGSDTQFELPLSIDASGIGENEWAVPPGAPMGDYDLAMIVGDRTVDLDQSFKIDEFKLPTMKATVSGPKDAAVRPRSLPLDLYVGYLSGGGAPNLPVDLRIAYFTRSKTPANYDSFSFGGAAVTEGTRPMNGDGEDETTPLPPTQSLPVTLGGDGTGHANAEVPALDANSDMLVEMDYQDANGEVLTASRRVPIFTSGVQLGVKTDGWLMKQDDLRLNFVALDTGDAPAAGRKIEVAVFSREILTARRRLIGGFYAYDNQMKTTKLAANCSATTDKLGLASCTLDPGVSGEVCVVATTTDADGNVSRAVKSVWLVGDDDWWFGGDNGDRMDLIAEKPEYAAGETARFQVRMPFREATALVTVEREGVLSSYVTHLSGTDPVVEVPMPGTYAPDVYVSVMVVRGRVGGWALWLSNLARDWGLPWFSREGARPTATVDLAKPAYRLGIAKVKVGWEGHRLDVAVKADKPKYAARDVAQVDVAVKRPDGKPATQADVAFVAVDEALLQLAPNESWDVLKAMMDERPIAVLTSTAQMQVVGKRHYGRKTAEPGGGGGGDLSALNRENFQPVLVWKGRVALDAQGHARVPVTLSDALTSFRLVAIATEGAQLFGMGEASVRSSQDLQVFAGLPPLVRTGDRYAAGFTLRNASDKPMQVTAEVAVTPMIARGRPIAVTIPAGGAVPIAWNLTAPGRPGQLSWKVTARSADGKGIDAITVAQEVAPAVPVETWAASLARVGDAPIMIAPPAGALPGLGRVDVTLADTLAPPLAGVRDYMSGYPYNCFEQRLSKAVALGDAGAWTALAAEIPTYQDGDGLLRYFPASQLSGSEALTSYVLSLTAEAGLPMPEASKARMVEALKAVLDGRLRHEDYGDLRLQKLAAFAALARSGAASADMLGQIGLAPNDMPTASLSDYIVAIGKTPGIANAAALREQAEGVLRSRLVYEGTRLDLSDQSTASWWLMSSGDESAIKALLSVLGRPGWQDEGPKMMVGVALRQMRGHWDTTTANAWGTVAAQRFAGIYPATAIAGITTASLGSSSVSRNWPLAPAQRSFSLALPPAKTPLTLSQSGGAGPWAMVTVKAAVPLRQPLYAGYRMTKKTDVVQARTRGVLTRGDVVKVTITVDASAERNWVVINDPVPAGATVVGGMANQSSMLGALADGGSGVSPSYVERGKDAWRAYFAWVPRGSFTVSYVMRLNGAGTLQVPPTRVEAMYSPAIRAQLPNATMTVAQR